MLIALSVLLGTPQSIDQSYMEATLDEKHWFSAEAPEIKSMETAFLHMAKLPTKELRRIYVEYLEAPRRESVSELFWVSEQARTEWVLRSFDIGVLSRIAFENPEKALKNQWFGPAMYLEWQKVWVKSGNSYRLSVNEFTVLLRTGPVYDPLSEFDYLARAAKRRRFLEAPIGF